MDLRQTAEQHGDQPFLVDMDGTTTVSYTQLIAMAERYALYLSQHGVGPRSPVLVTIGNELDYVVTAFSLLLLRAVLVPLDIRHFREALGLIVENAAALHVVAPAGAVREPRLARLTVLSPPAIAPVPAGSLPDDPLQPDDPIVVLYTSGTTGTPKGVVLHAGAVSANFLSYGKAMAFGEDTRFLQMMPVFHADGWNFSLLLPFLNGCSVVLTPPFDVTVALKMPTLLTAARPNVLVGVPSMLDALVCLKHRFERRPEHPLEVAISSSEPLRARTKAAFEECFGAQVCDLYGLTETQIIAYLTPSMTWKEGVVGRLHEGVESRVSEDGELQIRSPYLFSGYQDDPVASDAAYVDGWFRTGDIAEVDPSYMVHLKGRIEDTVYRGGRKIPAEVINAALCRVPGVADCVTLGLHGPPRSEIVAFVEPAASDHALSADLLLSSARRALGPRAAPDRVVVATIPRTMTGKVDRAVLRASLVSKLGRSQAR